MDQLRFRPEASPAFRAFQVVTPLHLGKFGQQVPAVNTLDEPIEGVYAARPANKKLNATWIAGHARLVFLGHSDLARFRANRAREPRFGIRCHVVILSYRLLYFLPGRFLAFTL